MMSKSTVTRLFVGSLLAIAGGLVLGFIAVLLGYTNGAFVMNGPDVVGVQSTAMAWTVAALVAIGLAIIAGLIGQFVAWIGAVLAYVLAGPDSATSAAKQRAIPIAAAPTGVRA